MSPVSAHTRARDNQGQKDKGNPMTHDVHQIKFGSMFTIAISGVVSSAAAILLAS